MKKNFIWSMLTVMMVAMLSVGFASCGGDDDDDSPVVIDDTDDGIDDMWVLKSDPQYWKSLVGKWGLAYSEPLEEMEPEDDLTIGPRNLEKGTTYDPQNPTSRENQRWEINIEDDNKLSVSTLYWSGSSWKWDTSGYVYEEGTQKVRLYVDLWGGPKVRFSGVSGDEFWAESETTRMSFKRIEQYKTYE